MGRKRDAIEQLRTAIDCLPVDTRIAMLQGVRDNEIVVGAYSTRDGGICPMLAAHRNGGRTDFITFARSWDRFARAPRGGSRRASERELRVLTTHLEASLLAQDGTELRRAIREHRELVARHARDSMRLRPGEVAADGPDAGRSRPTDPDRSRELHRRAGWAWLRPFRRLDDYERALARVEAQRDALAEQTDEQEPTGAPI
jgi:hypothetical protein